MTKVPGTSGIGALGPSCAGEDKGIPSVVKGEEGIAGAAISAMLSVDIRTKNELNCSASTVCSALWVELH